MSQDHPGWLHLLRDLLADVVELLGAELGAAQAELASPWRRIGRIAALLGVALFLAFWCVGLAAAALVLALAGWLPPWAAALVATAVVAIVAAVLAAVGVAQAKRLENPLRVVLRRLDDHLEWWRTEVALRPPDEGPETLPAGPPPEVEG